MKKLFLFTIIAVILTSSIFISCKKKEKDINKNEFELTVYNSSNETLDLINNELKIYAKLIPAVFANSVNITVTSEADPAGFAFTADLIDGEFKDGKYLYLYKELSELITAANETNVEDKLIKVSSNGDVININIENGALQDDINIDCRKILTYSFSSASSSNIEIYGYSFTGNEREAVQISTGRVTNPRLVRLEFDGNYKGFGKYYQYIRFQSADYSIFVDEEYWIGINEESGSFVDDITLLYNDKTITTAYGESASVYLE